MSTHWLFTLFRTLQDEWREFKQTLFPLTRIEIALFLFFFTVYAFIGFQLFFNTQLLNIYHSGAGNYLGYDNLFHLHTRGGAFDICHPFFNLFHLLKTGIIQLFSVLFKEKAAYLICLPLMNFLVTSALIFIYRYLRQIIMLPVHRALLLTGFTGSFFTTIVLSFTTETYPFSFCILVLSLFIFSTEFKQTKTIKKQTICLFTFLCGGITITNAAKPMAALFLNKSSFLQKCKVGSKISVLFIGCVAIIMGFYTLKNHWFDSESVSPLEATYQIKQYFIYDNHFSKQLLIDFWGNTILSTPLTPQQVGKEIVLRPSDYLYDWQNITIIFLLILVITSAILNIKNRYVQLLLMYLSVDGIVHFIFRYGMNEAILFGGHWMFTIPFLLGWLYPLCPTRIHYIIDLIIISFFLLIATSNIIEFVRIQEILQTNPA